MLDSIRVIMVLEATGSKELLANYLKSQIEHITHVDTMVDALSTVKRQRFDVAILSNDLEDYYSIENMIKILNDIGSIDDILLVSEKELPPDSPAISLENPMEAHVRILRELEKFSLHTGAKPLRKRATKGGEALQTPPSLTVCLPDCTESSQLVSLSNSTRHWPIFSRPKH